MRENTNSLHFEVFSRDTVPVSKYFSDSRYITGKCHTSEYVDMNEALYKWFCIACSENIFPGCPELMEKAKEIAIKLGKPNFKGSRGWLEKWKKLFNIKELKICGEFVGNVDGATVESRNERLPEIVQGYEKDDIWNMDETGLFGKHCQKKVLVKNPSSAKEGKN